MRSVVSRTAEMLGKQDDAKKYAQLADVIRTKFNEKYLDSATGIYGVPGTGPQFARWCDPMAPEIKHENWWPGNRTCTQAGQSLALALGVVPEAIRAKAEAALVREVAAHANHISSGFVATPYVLECLADVAPEAGYAMTTAQDYPSWYSMTAGTDHDLMQEIWTGRPAFMPSLGGNIAGWHMRALGGIRPDPAGPGFKKIVIKPNVVGDLHWVESHYDSVHGRIVSNWYKRGNQLVMDIAIPANTTATVYVPGTDATQIREGDNPAASSEGVHFLRIDRDSVVFAVQSGVYRFVMGQLIDASTF